MRSFHYRPTVLLAALLLLSGCVLNTSRLHYTIRDNAEQALPRKVLIVPAGVTVSEFTAGGEVREVPEWSAQANEAAIASARQLVAQHPNLIEVELPALTEEERGVLDEHVALYDVVGADAFMVTQIPMEAWKHKSEHFDYGLGARLAFLKEKSGADAALIVVGGDVISTGGRKFMFLLAAAMGVGIPMGHSYMHVGLVDLNTGNLLWMNHRTTSGATDLRRQPDIDNLLTDIFTNYPGTPEELISKRRAAYSRAVGYGYSEPSPRPASASDADSAEPRQVTAAQQERPLTEYGNAWGQHREGDRAPSHRPDASDSRKANSLDNYSDAWRE